MSDFKVISYNYSLSERLMKRLSFRFFLLKDKLFRVVGKPNKSFSFDRTIEEKEFNEENYIITCYFTKLKDPIKGFVRNEPNYKYIAPWYNSMTKLGLNGIIVHDGLTEEFINEYQTDKIKFILYKPEGYSIFEERWMAYYLILTNNSIKSTFITDSNDIVVNKNPFKQHTSNDKIYVGRDQANRVGDSQWVLDEMNTYIKESGYKVNPIVKHQILFNAGILGGKKEKITPIIQRIIELTHLTTSDTHKDMSLINIAINELIKPKINMKFYQEKLVNPETDFGLSLRKVCTGFPLNSAFQKFETDSEATFYHK